MHILVASDLSARSEPALRRGVALSRALDAELAVSHVVDEALPEPLRRQSVDWAERALSEALERLDCPRGTVEVVAGDPRRDIARVAGRLGSDLIVLGMHAGGGGQARRFADTTAGAILKSTLKAVLVARGDGEPYRQAVVGVDFSMFSVAAVRQAAALAPRAELHLVHAYHVPFEGFLGNTDPGDDIAYQERLQLDEFLQSEMAHLEQRAASAAGPVRTHLEEGPASDVLREVCGRVGADLVVIGTHSRASLSRAIWGSVATELLGNPPCDVLVVKPFSSAGRRGSS